MKNKIVHLLRLSFMPVFCALILFASLRGLAGNPSPAELNTKTFKAEGPFELSPERGRFALTYSLAEDRSIFFSIPIARFVTPDLGYWNGKFVSLFAPGLSVLVLPGYYLGKLFGASQIGTFAMISVFALLNFILIRRLSRRIGASPAASSIAGLIFLFATPAYAYAVNLYQHHISTFLILLSLLIVIRPKLSWLNFFTIWFLCAFSLLIDYPNLFLMAPIGLAAFFKIVIIRIVPVERLKIIFSFRKILSFTGAVLPILAFAAFNYYSYGSPTRLSGTVPFIAELDENGKPVTPRDSAIKNIEDIDFSQIQSASALNFFNPRNFVNGLFIQLFSPDRGIIIYAPVLLFSVFGLIYMYRIRHPQLSLLLSISSVNIILYTMWGDPWGGWAFGSRYLIPGYAVTSLFISVFLTVYVKKLYLTIPFLVISVYSIGVNTLGAITTSALPPKVQVLELEKLSGTIQRYTWQRNWEMLASGRSKSFFYNSFVSRYLKPDYYFYSLTGLITLAVIFQLTRLFREKYASRILRHKI